MIGIIGGTGLYSIDGLEVTSTDKIDTPFGSPSAPLTKGRLGSANVVFLPRHGALHSLLPSEINYRANIWALKAAGARQIVSVSATGSLVKEIEPGQLALPSQYLDMTKGKRPHTYFGDGLVAHISTAQPVCPQLSQRLQTAAKAKGITIHSDKTYACVEGPRLGTRAESFFLKGAGCDLVGMTNVPEVFLAREAQMCYSTIAVATDYDCWMDDPAFHVTIDRMMALYRKSIEQVKTLLQNFLNAPQTSDHSESCSCRHSLKEAVLTPETTLSKEKQTMLAFLRQ